MHDQDIWHILNQAGIRVRQHYTDPAIGWFGVTRWDQCGPFPTREEALRGALQSLVQRIDDAGNDLGRRKQRETIGKWLEGILGLFHWL